MKYASPIDRELRDALAETPPVDHARADVARARGRRARDAYGASEGALSRELAVKFFDA